MGAIIINGKEIASKIRQELKAKLNKIYDEKGVKLGLATVIVGGDPASVAYVKNKEKVCSEVGLNSFTYELPYETSQEEMVRLINELNFREDVHGILIQVPLPKHIDENTIANVISPMKDVDGFNTQNSGKLFRGEKCLIPCTAKGILRLIKESGIKIEGKKATVVGRSNIVGKPAAMLLLKENATVTLCHSRTKNLKDELYDADIIISAVGKKGLIKSDMVKEGAVVIDAGTSVYEGKLFGDVDFENVKEKASYITPVPGGVGSMTTTMLIENVLEASQYDV